MKRAAPEPSSENGEAERPRTDVKVGRLMRAGTGWTSATPGSASAATAAAAAGTSTSTGLPRPPPAALLGLPPSPKCRYVLKATPKMAGAIIGAKGATVTRLRQESGATLHASEARGQEQDIEFGGTDEQIATAVRLVKEVLAANNPPHPTDWTLKTLVTFTVPNHVVGAAIIGKGGCRVQGVRDQSGATVDVSAAKDKEGVADGRQTVSISGTFAQVSTAYAALLDNINKYCPLPEGVARTRTGPTAGGRGQQQPQHQQAQQQRAQPAKAGGQQQQQQQLGAQELDALAVAQAGAQRAQHIAMALAAGAALPRPPMQVAPAAIPGSAPYGLGAPLGAPSATGMQPAPAAPNPLAAQLWQAPQNGAAAAAAAPPAQVLFYNPADGSIKPISITAEQATNAVAQHHLHQVMQQQVLLQQQAQAQALALVQAQQQQPSQPQHHQLLAQQQQPSQQQQTQQQSNYHQQQQQQQSPQQHQQQQHQQEVQPPSLPPGLTPPQASAPSQMRMSQPGQPSLEQQQQQQQQQQWPPQQQAWQQAPVPGAAPQQAWLQHYQQQQPQQTQAPMWPGYQTAAWPVQAQAAPAAADAYGGAAMAQQQGYGAAAPAGMLAAAVSPSGYGVMAPRAPSVPPPRPPLTQHQPQRQHW